MTSNQPTSSNPVFHTPQSDELQSEESKEAVRQRLSEAQGSETDVIDDQAISNDTQPTGSVGRFEDMDALADRHLPSVDSPPG